MELDYRRGYQQGAAAVFELAKVHLPVDAFKKIQSYVYVDVYHWRLDAEANESADNMPPPLFLLGSVTIR